MSRISALLLACLLAAPAARASVPLLLSQAGRLLQANDTPATGTLKVRFELHETSDTSLRNAVWFDERDVTFSNGYYGVTLGDVDRGGKALDPAVLAKQTLYMSVVIENTELTPRIRVASAPFALRAGRAGLAETVVAGSIDAAALASEAVVEAKLAAGAVSTRALGAGSVTEPKLADAAVSTRALAADAVTEAKIAADAVTAAKLAENAVVEAKLAAGAVTEAKLGDGAVTEAKLAEGAVSLRALAAKAVAEAKLADGAVSARSLGAKSVSEEKLADGSVSGRALAATSVTPSHLHADVFAGSGSAATAARSDHTHADYVTKADRNASFAWSNSKRQFAFQEGDWRKMTNFDDLAITTKGNPLLVHVTFQINDDICFGDGERYAVACQLVVDNKRYVMGMSEHDTWCDFETVYNYTSVVPVDAGAHTVFLECRHDRNNASNMNSNMGNRGNESPFTASSGSVGTYQDVIVVQELGR